MVIFTWMGCVPRSSATNRSLAWRQVTPECSFGLYARGALGVIDALRYAVYLAGYNATDESAFM
jgi:hypothetical protein